METTATTPQEAQLTPEEQALHERMHAAAEAAHAAFGDDGVHALLMLMVSREQAKNDPYWRMRMHGHLDRTLSAILAELEEKAPDSELTTDPTPELAAALEATPENAET